MFPLTSSRARRKNSRSLIDCPLFMPRSIVLEIPSPSHLGAGHPWDTVSVDRKIIMPIYYAIYSSLSGTSVRELQVCPEFSIPGSEYQIRCFYQKISKDRNL